MPPKNKKDTSDEDNGSMIKMMRAMQAQLSGQLSGLSDKIEKMDSRFDVIDRDVHDVKVILYDLKTENKQLKSEVKAIDKKLQDMDERNNALENRINQLEQHHRGWRARVLNVPLSPEEETDNFSVVTKVYNLVLLPILQGALERKMLRYIPSADQLLEVAHVLPGKTGEPKPIIMRFYNRDIKDTIFKLKKYYAPRVEQSGQRGGGGGGRGAATGSDQEPGGFEGRGKFCFPIYEDLTWAKFCSFRSMKIVYSQFKFNSPIYLTYMCQCFMLSRQISKYLPNENYLGLCMLSVNL
jgi:hypothetical protein